MVTLDGTLRRSLDVARIDKSTIPLARKSGREEIVARKTTA
jgi:hypothetical protein